MTVTCTNSEKETEDFAQRLARGIKPGSFIALCGPLGAGKTAFVRGLAKGLGVKEKLSSPTFTLLKAYDSGSVPLYHYDVYRINGCEELDDTGFYDYAVGDGVCVCEWAELIENELPPERINVNIEYVDENKRKIVVENRA